jgi:hypothetical protein
MTLRKIVERLWKDVESLPWGDDMFAAPDSEWKAQTRRHFVEATVSELSDMMVEQWLENAVKMLDEEMEQNPSRALADASNYLQTRLNERRENATDRSKDD